ncbi:Hypothetical protein SMAX5B_005082 [Scophthalmus maximus]|uniref:Uncharacterized protein n=1 Tax=Scophthalmus maximus TaxID=52904 RepID=A0A2U9BXZ0_SCOMX|nr:Hypothetical protein SMAX5B_005082 [Scophthalmus maximus]
MSAIKQRGVGSSTSPRAAGKIRTAEEWQQLLRSLTSELRTRRYQLWNLGELVLANFGCDHTTGTSVVFAH